MDRQAGTVEARRGGSLAPGALALTPTKSRTGADLFPQAGAGGGCGCNAAADGALEGSTETGYPFVYALGRVEARFPSLALEKEFVQVQGRADTAGLTDQQALQRVLSQPQNRYITRQLCWVLTIEGIETYILIPRHSEDLEMLVEAIRATPSRLDVDVVVGIRGPVAGPEVCNGLMLPLVAFDQIYSFDRDALIKALPRLENSPAAEDAQFRTSAGELFDRIQQIADNAGATDEHRALNYISVRYPAVYETVAAYFNRRFSLTQVRVIPSRLSGVRKIVDVILEFVERSTDFEEKVFVRVDVTEEFPFLVSKLAPYYDR